LLSGDWIPVTLPDRVRALVGTAEVVSLGGATEASIWSISYPITTVDPEWVSIPYGRALRGQSFHILDEDGGPCPVGQVGELYIGGPGLARGYLGDEEQTRDWFAVHDVLGERLYRTGDVGRWRTDGEIEFLGRTDRQVKVQGYRIELGELESVANRLPGVRQCVAATTVGPDGLRRLVAYVVMHAAATAPTEADLRAEFRRHLPDYMVPTWVIPLEVLPVTANGKIDHAALPEPRS
jgi:acyl-coenzyme A synthetase/AMP-(fatty) acid ligase